jgi:hypothetical protein
MARVIVRILFMPSCVRMLVRHLGVFGYGVVMAIVRVLLLAGRDRAGHQAGRYETGDLDTFHGL